MGVFSPREHSKHWHAKHSFTTMHYSPPIPISSPTGPHDGSNIANTETILKFLFALRMQTSQLSRIVCETQFGVRLPLSHTMRSLSHAKSSQSTLWRTWTRTPMRMRIQHWTWAYKYCAMTFSCYYNILYWTREHIDSGEDSDLDASAKYSTRGSKK